MYSFEIEMVVEGGHMAWIEKTQCMCSTHHSNVNVIYYTPVLCS